jgi:hypothetical protein
MYQRPNNTTDLIEAIQSIVILGLPRNKITEKEWASILRMAKYQDGATFILKDEKGLDVSPKVEYEWYVKEKMASGGYLSRYFNTTIKLTQ